MSPVNYAQLDSLTLWLHYKGGPKVWTYQTLAWWDKIWYDNGAAIRLLSLGPPS